MTDSVQSPPRRRNAPASAVFVDLVISALSLLVAFSLVCGLSGPTDWLRVHFLVAAPSFVFVKFIVFAALHHHQRSWRYAGDRDAAATLLAGTAASAMLFGLTWVVRGRSQQAFMQQAASFPDAVLVIDWITSLLLMTWSRLAWRAFHGKTQVRTDISGRKLILGAGDAGDTLLRELQRLRPKHHEIVGFLDDDSRKHGVLIHGVPVLGGITELPEHCAAQDIDEVLIAMPSATPQRVRQIFEMSREADYNIRIVPDLAELIEGPITIESQLRPVRLEDLLSREPVQLDHEAIAACVAGHTVMVTGAGGSIGSELCRQITRFNPRKLVLVEQSENGLFEVQNELHRLAAPEVVHGHLADIGDRRRMRTIFESERPALVCHAAAHKHVGVMEAHPGEGIKNNIIGTRCLAELALEFGVSRFVMVSTDKAIRPSSVMGCTKRVAEMVVQSLDGQGATRFSTVRFGNVLGSRGSVVPIFQEQIARGGPLTVTDPEATRFFMTIPEAAQLILQAGALGHGGEIFVLEMGQAIRILDMARQLIIMSGRRPGDIDVVYTGLRPGEKLHEELFMEGEQLQPTAHPHIRVCDGLSLDEQLVNVAVEQLIALADCDDRVRIRAQLAAIVPEYTPQDAEIAQPAG